MLQDVKLAALKEREYFWKFLVILSNFKPKKSPFWPFLKKNSHKFKKIYVLVAKNNQNLKKLLRSIFIP